jgi:hypothetical protein
MFGMYVVELVSNKFTFPFLILNGDLGTQFFCFLFVGFCLYLLLGLLLVCFQRTPNRECPCFIKKGKHFLGLNFSFLLLDLLLCTCFNLSRPNCSTSIFLKTYEYINLLINYFKKMVYV